MNTSGNNIFLDPFSSRKNQASRYQQKRATSLLEAPQVTKNASSSNVMFFDQFADDDLIGEDHLLKEAENAGKIQKALKSIVNLSRESLKLQHQEEREGEDSPLKLGTSLSSDRLVLSSDNKVSRAMPAPVLVEDVDFLDRAPESDPSTKTTVI